MKNCIFAIIFSLFMLNRAAAQYIVVKVTGNVTYGAKAIAPGTELKKH